MGYTHGYKWSDDEIEKQLRFVIQKLELDHFPTHSEMILALGNKSLACAISKRQGTRFWSEKLNIPLSYSDTTLGNKYEIIAVDDIYEELGLHSVITSSRHPYDLLTNNSVKIDVKVSKPFVNKCNVKSHTFNLEKKEPTCDIYVFYCVDNSENIIKRLIVPSCSLLGQSQIGVGDKSRWDKYKDKWNYISEYSDFYSNYIN